MSIVTMNMSSFEVERNAPPGHEDEVMSSGWIPALGLQTCIRSEKPMPRDLIEADAESFLGRMYAYQR